MTFHNQFFSKAGSSRLFLCFALDRYDRAYLWVKLHDSVNASAPVRNHTIAAILNSILQINILSTTFIAKRI